MAVPDCYKDYTPAIEKVNNIYKKAQYRHSLVFKDQYVYEFFPTTMFPFFCAQADTVKKLLPYETIYLCDATIGLNLDKKDNKHISIAVLQYVTIKGNAPEIKKYTMYFFKWDPDTKTWDEERIPLVVNLYLNKNGSYRSK
jgi:hypothetical protein